MIDYNKEIVEICEKILPTYHESLRISQELPCITYREDGNYSVGTGDTVEYSVLRFQLKVWTKTIAELQNYSLLLDRKMAKAKFTRLST